MDNYISCKKFVTHANGSEYYQNYTDIALKLNSYSLKYYRLIYNNFTNNDEVDHVVVNYSII